MSASNARRDLIRKLELEKKLMRDLSKLNNKIVAGTIREFANNGLAFNANLLEDELTTVLDTHYLKTADIFSTQITKELPSEIAITVAEETSIRTALAAYFIARAAEQAAIITDTNQKNINSSLAAASETLDADDKPLPRRDQAREAGVLVAVKLRGRLQSIATTETQNAAETSKATEAEVLSGRAPSIVAGSSSDAGVDKEWFSVGDENVREAHIRADGQTRDLSKPYTVDGQLLRWPGDTSLGASAGNVMNCRCSSTYDAKAVFAIRRRKAQDPFTETVATPQMIESVGQ